MVVHSNCARSRAHFICRGPATFCREFLLGLMLLTSLCWVISADAAAAQYIYDAGGRLVQVVAPDGSSARYRYDPVGNITAIDRLTASTVAISSFAPASGSPGSTVRVSGSGFSATPSANAVTLNGASVVVTASSANSLTFTVPSAASSGKITISTGNGSATSVRDYIVDYSAIGGPTITSISPNLGAAGSSFTVNGTGFQSQIPYNRVLISKVVGTVTSATVSALRATVGAGAVTGKVKVETPFGFAVSSQTFFIPPESYSSTNVVDAGQISFGSTQSVNISASGKFSMYSFEGAIGQQVSIHVSSSNFTNCGSGVLKLYSPEGKTISTSTLCNDALIESGALTVSGTYLIVVSPASTGTLTLALNNIVDVASAITVDGPTVTQTTTTPGQNMKLTFSGSVGQRVSLTVSGASSFGYYTIKILNPDGTTYVLSDSAVGSSNYFSDVVTLTQAGTHTILFNPSSTGASKVGSATFSLKSVAPDAASAITVDGSAVTLTTTTPGQNMKLTFSGSVGQRVSLTVSGASSFGYYTIKILNPDGTTYVLSDSAVGSSSYFSDVVTLTQAGTHTISFNPSSTGETKFGSATFSLKSVAPDATGAITVDGSAVTLTTTTPGQNMKLTFSGSVGQRVSLNISGASTFSYYGISILNPDGTTYTIDTASSASTYFSDVLTLTQTGTHTIRFNPFSAGATKVGSATFSLKSVAPDVMGTITVDGSSVTLTTMNPGQNMKLTFSGSVGQRVSLSISGASAFAYYGISILNPDGTTYTLDTASSASTYSSGAKTLSQSGTHTILFNPKSSGATNIGSATFSLVTPP